MIKVMYTLFDNVARVYGMPFYAPSLVVATRDLLRATKDPQSQLHHNPRDFDLFECGTFNDETGQILTAEAPIHVINVEQLARETQ